MDSGSTPSGEFGAPRLPSEPLSPTSHPCFCPPLGDREAMDQFAVKCFSGSSYRPVVLTQHFTKQIIAAAGVRDDNRALFGSDVTTEPTEGSDVANHFMALAKDFSKNNF